MNDGKIQTGLRIPQSRYDELKEMADRSGISLNSMILFLVDVGLLAVNLGVEGAAHFSSHIPQHIDGQ